MNYLDNAKLNDHLEISVDWLSFTFTSITDHTEVIRFLGYSLDELVSMPCGKSGYLYSLKSSMYNIYFLYGGREDMGVHVDVSGSAVSGLLQHFVSSRLVKTPFNSTALPVHGFDEAEFSEFIRWIFSHGGSFTRLDLALDNKHDLYYSVEDLWSAVSSGQYVSIFRTKQYTQSITGNDPSGSTLSFGRRGGACFLGSAYFLCGGFRCAAFGSNILCRGVLPGLCLRPYSGRVGSCARICFGFAAAGTESQHECNCGSERYESFCAFQHFVFLLLVTRIYS